MKGSPANLAEKLESAWITLERPLSPSSLSEAGVAVATCIFEYTLRLAVWWQYTEHPTTRIRNSSYSSYSSSSQKSGLIFHLCIVYLKYEQLDLFKATGDL